MSNFKDMVNRLLDEDFYHPEADSTYMKIYEVDKQLFGLMENEIKAEYPEMYADLREIHSKLMEVLKKISTNKKSEQPQI